MGSQSEILINNHKRNQVHCINIKIEDHILKYKEYPKQYQSRYQLGDFQSHPRSKDKTSAKNKTSIKIVFQVFLLQSLCPLYNKFFRVFITKANNCLSSFYATKAKNKPSSPLTIEHLGLNAFNHSFLQ